MDEKSDCTSNKDSDQFDEIELMILACFENDRGGNVQEHPNNNGQKDVKVEAFNSMAREKTNE